MTAETTGIPAPDRRPGRLEGPVGDFPFYDGVPVSLSGARWLFVMAAVVVAFVVLVAPLPWPEGPLGSLIPAVLFAAIPLAALARVAPGHWTAIFGRVGGRELRLMIGFALLNVVLSMGVGILVRAVTDVTPNAAATALAAMGTVERVAFLARTLPQLLGEELVTLLPFLALLTLLTARLRVGRRRAVVVAWVVTSLLFGLLHLPTYDWNLVQCVVVIGTARMVLTLAWILTKNVWVSTGAHVLNDWFLFALSLVGAGLAGAG